MAQDRLIAVTGATGELGGRVARRLASHGIAQRLIVREAARAPQLPGASIALAASYADDGGMRAALTGAHALFLVSGREAPDRLAQHVAAVDAAVAAGVAQIVYLSCQGAAPDATFTFARQHFHTEEHIRATGLPFTFLRMCLYLDFVPGLVGADGVIRGPAGEGRAAFVARDDLADVAAVVLATGGQEGLTLDVTGPEALTLAECAAQLSEATSRAITFHDESLEEARASRAQYGAPAFEVEGWISSYLAIAEGEFGPAAGTVARLAGHPPQTLRDYLARYPESYRQLLPAAP